MTLKKVARINANDDINDQVILFLVNPETFEITSSIGEDVTFGDSAHSAAEAFEVIGEQWNWWKTFEWLAEYSADEITEI